MDNLYCRIDYSGGYGSNIPMQEDIIKMIIQNGLGCNDKTLGYFPNPGIAIYDENHLLIDKIYWRQNPERILHYFPNI